MFWGFFWGLCYSVLIMLRKVVQKIAFVSNVVLLVFGVGVLSAFVYSFYTDSSFVSYSGGEVGDTYSRGSLLVGREYDVGDVLVGDVIINPNSGGVTRVLSISEDTSSAVTVYTLEVQDDVNGIYSYTVFSQTGSVMVIVSGVPVVGFFVEFVSSPLVAGLLCVWFGFTILVSFVSSVKGLSVFYRTIRRERGGVSSEFEQGLKDFDEFLSWWSPSLSQEEIARFDTEPLRKVEVGK